jgi:putative NADH-flavin reductase
MAAGHAVTALVRNPTNLPGGIQIVTAELSAANRATLESAVRGADAVLSGLGPRALTKAGIAAEGTRAIVQAMSATNVRRIVVVSAAPIGTVASPRRPNPPKHDPGDGFFMRNLGAPFARTVFRERYADLALMEDIVQDSGLDWTIVRPPRLTNGPLSGSYRTAYGQNLRRGVLVSRADVAQFMLRALEQPETIGQVIGIAD